LERGMKGRRNGREGYKGFLPLKEKRGGKI